MSPLWRDELRVVLAPEQLVLVRLGWAMTRRGPIRRVMAKSVVDCAPVTSGEASWEVAIQTLDAVLPRLLVRKTAAKVVLSNHFTRYSLMPWSETLIDAAEEETYARHCFRQGYGAAAEHWELRLSPERAGLPQLASAVDVRLLAALRTVFERRGVAFDSLQPRLMAAYNHCRRTLNKLNAWFVMFEPGCLCLALLQHGRWASVRTMRIGSDWHNTLALALEREAYLAEPGTETKAVYLWAPELGKAELPDSDRWQVHHLHPVVRSAFIPEYEGRFAMALSGWT